MDKWVTGLFILILILFLGFAILDSQISTANQVTPEIAAGCPANQFVTSENATGALNCGAIGAVSTEAAAGCAGAQQFFTTESVNGAVSCGIVTYGTCPANQFATAITTTTLNCGAQAAVSTEAVASCGLGLFATTEQANGAFGTCGTINENFQSNLKACSISGSAGGSTVMAGFKLNYTIVATGILSVALTFQLTPPLTGAGLTTKYQLAYSNSTAPACKAAPTGTLIGNQYSAEQGTAGAFLNLGQSETVVVSHLTPTSTYWFDLQVTETGTTNTWSYSLPQLAVIES